MKMRKVKWAKTGQNITKKLSIINRLLIIYSILDKIVKDNVNLNVKVY